MNTPPWLQALALLAWGATLGETLGLAAGMLLGALLGGARLLAAGSAPRLQLDEGELNRGVDLTALLCVLTLAALLAAQGLPKGLLTATGWMPAALLPLLLIAKLNAAPLRLRHLAWSLRGSPHADAATVVQPDAPYLAITLLAAAVLAKPTPWLFWMLGSTVLVWLLVARPPPRRRGLLPFAGAALLALSLGFAATQGLQRAQLALQDWVLDSLTGDAGDAEQSQTRIGDLGRVKQSARIVWRVRQTAPTEVPLRLRSGVFTRYANGIWLAPPASFEPFAATPTTPRPRLRLRGTSVHGTALLPVPATTGAIAAPGRLERNALGVVRLGEAPALLEIAIDRGKLAPAAPTAADLAVAPEFAALLARLPELAALRGLGAERRMAGLEAWFAANFRYTLFIGDATTGRRDLERFLLAERAGHCEYFATATVLLLRALDIPARYVTGYSVQEYSRLEQAFVVRQRHAHAWAEAFVDGRWVELDTTPATWLGAEEDIAPVWQPLADFASFLWRRLGELRRDAFAGDRAAAAWSAAALLVLAALWLVRRRWQGAPRLTPKVGAGDTAPPLPNAELSAFRALEREFAAQGLGRHPSEPPRRWLARLATDGHSVLDAPRLAAAERVIDALYRQRYGLQQL